VVEVRKKDSRQKTVVLAPGCLAKLDFGGFEALAAD
jgi:hypothetical protein